MDEEVMEGQFAPEGSQGVNEFPADAPAPEAAAPKDETQPDFDPNQWGFKYKGKPFLPKDRNHLISLASQGMGATQRIEEYNKKEQELEQMKNQYSKYAELETQFHQNPQFASRIVELQNEFANGQNQTDEDPRLMQLTQKLEELEQWKSSQSQEVADRQLNDEMSQVMKSHPSHNWGLDEGDGPLSKRLLKHAYDNGINNLETAYRDFFWDHQQQTAKGQALKQATNAQKQAHKAGIVQPGTQGGVPPQVGEYKKSDSWNDVGDKALKALGG